MTYEFKCFQRKCKTLIWTMGLIWQQKMWFNVPIGFHLYFLLIAGPSVKDVIQSRCWNSVKKNVRFHFEMTATYSILTIFYFWKERERRTSLPTSTGVYWSQQWHFYNMLLMRYITKWCIHFRRRNLIVFLCKCCLWSLPRLHLFLGCSVPGKIAFNILSTAIGWWCWIAFCAWSWSEWTQLKAISSQMYCLVRYNVRTGYCFALFLPLPNSI